MKYFKLLYTALLFCVLIPLNAQFATADINQTPKKMEAKGNVLTNDRGTSLVVQSATYLNSLGASQPLTLNQPTQIYNSTGYLVGAFQLKADGNYTLTPDQNFVGEVSVRYIMKDGNNKTDSAPLTIKVINFKQPSVNSLPIAHDDTSFQVVSKGNISSNALVNDKDADGSVLTVNSASQNSINIPINSSTQLSGVDFNGNTIANAGSFKINANGAYTFTPITGFIGKVNPVNYTVIDTSGGTNKANIHLRILPAGNYTFANDDANLKLKGISMEGNVLLNDSDPTALTQRVRTIKINGVISNVPSTSGSDISINIPSTGIFKINSLGVYSFSPTQNFAATLPIEINVCNAATPASCDKSMLYLTSLGNSELCYEEVAGKAFSWNYPNSPSTEIMESMTQPGTNGGFAFDIYELDNSFNMMINSIKLATKEIEFQTSGTPGQTVRFADGSVYGSGGIMEIFQMYGSAANPLIRVIIDPFGNVSMYGSKTINGPLFPLELFNGASFNTISWNSTTNNQIIISQRKTGPTTIDGYGYGRNIIPCAPCTLPGNFSSTGLPTNVGVTSLREGNSNNWPQIREGAWIALESKTKGFVPNRLTATQIAAIPILDLVAGMMVYNITEDCLQINVNGSVNGWQCFKSQGCGE